MTRVHRAKLPLGFRNAKGTQFAKLLRKGDSIDMKKVASIVGGSLLTLAFLFGISVAASGTVEAQYRNDGQYRRHDRDRDNDGDRDWRRNRRERERWERERQRRASQVYNNRGYGTYGTYGTYGGYGGYGNSGSQYELNRGYQEGLNTGSSDARRGQSYSPQRSHWWRDARTQAFREGFARGYDQGFRQYAGYGNGGYGRNTGGILGGILGRRY